MHLDLLILCMNIWVIRHLNETQLGLFIFLMLISIYNIKLVLQQTADFTTAAEANQKQDKEMLKQDNGVLNQTVQILATCQSKLFITHLAQCNYWV